MSKETVIQLLQQGQATLPVVLLDNYQKLSLNETELMALLHIQQFIVTGQNFPSLQDIAGKMSIHVDQCAETLRGLLRKGFLAIKQVKNGHIIVEYYSVEPMWEQLANYLLLQEQKEKAEPVESLYTIFEQEFGRPLSPIECETLVMWEEQEEHTPLLIKAALKEAVMSGKVNFRYIDRILFEWKKNGIKTVEQAYQQGQKFRSHQKQLGQGMKRSESIPVYNWLDED